MYDGVDGSRGEERAMITISYVTAATCIDGTRLSGLGKETDPVMATKEPAEKRRR